MGAFVSPKLGILGLIATQALATYFFCFLMSRSDSTTVAHYVVFGLGVGFLGYSICFGSICWCSMDFC